MWEGAVQASRILHSGVTRDHTAWPSLTAPDHHHFGRPFSLRVFVHPILCGLIKCRPVILELFCNPSLNCIIRLRRCKDRPNQREHILDLVRRLPRICSEHAETHGTALIVGHVWVVDLGLKADDRRLEWVVFGKGDEDNEAATLGYVSVSSCLPGLKASTHRVRRVWRTLHVHLPVVDVALVRQLDLAAFGRIAVHIAQLLPRGQPMRPVPTQLPILPS